MNMLRNMLYTIHQKKRGFLLPFAVLLSGVLLSIGLAVFNIILKEVILSSSARDSQFAFYAADTGGECALYWDAKFGIFATSSQTPVYNGSFTCGGATIVTPTGWSIIGNSLSATTTFSFSSANYCAIVTVAKWAPNNTKIESEGFNTCSAGDPRRVERAVRITY